MPYSEEDIFLRIKTTLPGRWFAEYSPVLDSLLKPISAGWIGLFKLLDYTKLQTRIGTACDVWLDLIALDYFKHYLRRRLRETDESLRTRILYELGRDRCTRAAVQDLLRDLTGKPPLIFEPANPLDTGCYGSLVSVGVGTVGYGISGGWGSLKLPFQAFIRAFRPAILGVTVINGWGGSAGGFGCGNSAYISAEMDASLANEDEIYENVSRTAPAGTIIWMSIGP